MEPDNPLLDQYVLNTIAKTNPIVCFLPTASGDSDNYITRFYAAFSKLPCRPRHLSLFSQPADLAAFVAACDVIYVGGGNTRNMLAIWRACHMDAVLHRAWEDGIVCCAESVPGPFAGLSTVTPIRRDRRRRWLRWPASAFCRAVAARTTTANRRGVPHIMR